MDRQKKAYIFTALSILCWATVSTAFKICLQYVDYLQMLLISSFTSLLTLFFILLIQNKLRTIKNYSAGEILRSLFLGVFNPFLYYIILFKAYSEIPAQLALTLNYTWALMVVLLSVPILKQKITISQFFAIMLSFAGAVVIASKGSFLSYNSEHLFGMGLAFGSSLVWASYWLFNVKDRKDDAVKLFLNFLSGFILILAATLIFSEFPRPPLEGLLAAVYIGLFEMGLTFIFWLSALRYSKNTATVSNLIYLTPFLSLFIINLILKEEILISTFVGLAMIIAGIIYQQRKRGEQ